MIMPKKHFNEGESIMLLLFTPEEFSAMGGHSVMRQFKERFERELDEAGYDLDNFQLRYKPRYKDILIYVRIFDDEKKLEKEMIEFFQEIKNKYLLDYGNGDIAPIKRVYPIPIEEQPSFK